ncbi:MAG: SlyX family protein [Steroidobacteraceae bacterium]|jgi:SlyX protein
MNEDLLERIETKIAYLERANAELSEVVFRQQREIQALAEALAQTLEARMKMSAERPQSAAAAAAEERPPHY